ncbi:MAG: hypothetical protein LC799_29800 [Actinobacteria bacterium]|nr:hypothetical protein [Actinomycetota bacterium]
MGWIATRDVDPRKGATWDPQSDLWFVWIPDTEDMCGNKMACSYRIDHRARTVTCEFFGSLRYP